MRIVPLIDQGIKNSRWRLSSHGITIYVKRMKFSVLAKAAVLAAPILAALPGTGTTQAVVSSGQSFINAQLLAGERQPDGTRMAGLRMTLEPGWKTYWRSPGETGIPPQLDWSASTNIARIDMLWPRPEVFESFGYQTIGYSHQVVFPLHITPADPAQPVDLRLEAMIGVCKELCVLEHVELTETIAPDMQSSGYSQIMRAVRAVPQTGEAAGLVRAECRVTGAGKDRQLDLTLAFDQPLNEPVVLVEGTPEMWVHSLETTTRAGGADVTAAVTLGSETAWIDRSAFRITVLDGYMAAELQGCSAPG